MAVVDRFEVAVVAKAVLDTVQPEPVIAIAARVGPLDDRAATIVVEALPRYPDALHLGGGEGGNVDVDQRARRHAHVEQRTQQFRDRKSAVQGTSVAVRVDLDGRRTSKK